MISEHSRTPQREKIEYDASDHPLYIRRSTLSDYSPTLSAICHYHDDIEFMYLLRGHISYNVNGRIYRIEKGEGMFVNAGNLHYGYSADGEDCNFICILVNPSLISATQYLYYQYVRPLTHNHAFPAAVLHNDLEWMRDLNLLIVRAYTVYTKKEAGFELALQSIFHRIWLLLYLNMPKDAKGKTNEAEMSVLRAVVTYIQEHDTEKIDLSDIAAAGNISNSYCCRLFKRYLRQSPMKYLRSCRLNRACTLLSDTSASITEISYRCGFSGTSYFIESFREKYGMTPTSYRKKVVHAD